MTKSKHCDVRDHRLRSYHHPFMVCCKRTLSDRCCRGDRTDVSLYWSGCPAGVESRSLAGKTGMWQEWSLSGRGQAVYSQLPWSEKCHQSFFKLIPNHLLFMWGIQEYTLSLCFVCELKRTKRDQTNLYNKVWHINFCSKINSNGQLRKW